MQPEEVAAVLANGRVPMGEARPGGNARLRGVAAGNKLVREVAARCQALWNATAQDTHIPTHNITLNKGSATCESPARSAKPPAKYTNVDRLGGKVQNGAARYGCMSRNVLARQPLVLWQAGQTFPWQAEGGA